MEFENFLIKQARSIGERWNVVALLTKGGSPISFATNKVSKKGDHAERRCLRRVNKEQSQGATLIVVRTRQSDGLLGLAKPCRDLCIKEIKEAGIRKIFYSTNEQVFEVEYL